MEKFDRDIDFNFKNVQQLKFLRLCLEQRIADLDSYIENHEGDDLQCFSEEQQEEIDSMLYLLASYIVGARTRFVQPAWVSEPSWLKELSDLANKLD